MENCIWWPDGAKWWLQYLHRRFLKRILWAHYFWSKTVPPWRISKISNIHQISIKYPYFIESCVHLYHPSRKKNWDFNSPVGQLSVPTKESNETSLWLASWHLVHRICGCCGRLSWMACWRWLHASLSHRCLLLNTCAVVYLYVYIYMFLCTCIYIYVLACIVCCNVNVIPVEPGQASDVM